MLFGDLDPAGSAVTFPAGSTSEVATVIAAMRDDRPGQAGRVLVFTDRTPFHPLDPLWSDQPDDRGQLAMAGDQLPVERALTVATVKDGRVLIDREVDVRRGDPDVGWHVAHQVEHFAGVEELIGQAVKLSVDTRRRAALSAAHTACHLVAHALNEVTDEFWRRTVPVDSRGARNFDALAYFYSRHCLRGSVDRYRLGKSLRRRGFNTDMLIERLPEVVRRVSGLLDEWLATGALVRIDVGGPRLADKRMWRCALPDGPVSMPCGGTHVACLRDIAALRLEVTLSPPLDELRVETRHDAASRCAP